MTTSFGYNDQALPFGNRVGRAGGHRRAFFTATGINGFDGPVTFFGLSGLLTGVRAVGGGTINYVAGGASAQYSLGASATASLGVATLTLQATSGTISHTFSIPLAVTAAPDFALNVPANTNVAPGSSQQITIGVTEINGYSNLVGVVLSGFGSGVTVSPSSFFVTPGTPQMATVTASQSAAEMPVAFTATAASGSLLHSLIATVDVGGSGETNFALSNGPNPLSIPIGGNAAFLPEQVAVNSFNGNVQVSVDVPLCTDPAAASTPMCLSQVLGSSPVTANPVNL